MKRMTMIALMLLVAMSLGTFAAAQDAGVEKAAIQNMVKVIITTGYDEGEVSFINRNVREYDARGFVVSSISTTSSPLSDGTSMISSHRLVYTRDDAGNEIETLHYWAPPYRPEHLASKTICDYDEDGNRIYYYSERYTENGAIEEKTRTYTIINEDGEPEQVSEHTNPDGVWVQSTNQYVYETETAGNQEIRKEYYISTTDGELVFKSQQIGRAHV